MGDYVQLFVDETERTQYESSAQYNEPYISATDDTFDAEYNKRQDKQYAVKYTDTEINVRDFAFVEYDAEIEYLESTGTQYIDTGVNYDFTGTIKIIAQVIPINQNRSIIISNYCDGNAASMSCELGGTSNSHALQPRFYMSLKKATTTKDTWRSAFTLNTSNEIILQYNKNNGQKIFTTQGSSTTEIFTGNKYGTPRNFILFLDHRSDKSAIAYGVRIQKIQIYINNQLVSDLIPVRVGNTGYMYDKVSCKLLGNSGTGNFVLGPDKYDAQIEYLESTGAQYINTKFIPKHNTIIDLRIRDTNLYYISNNNADSASTTYDSLNPFFGVQSSATNKFWSQYVSNVSGTDNTKYSLFWYNTNQSKFPSSSKYTASTFSSWHTLNFSGATVKLNGNSISMGAGNINTSDSLEYELYIFGINSVGVGFGGCCAISSFKITDNSTVIRDYIPVRKNNIGYMYDRVSGQLIGNAGSGQFVLGPDV